MRAIPESMERVGAEIAATVAAFTSATPISTTIPNDNFSNGDTATAEIPLTGNDPPVFFKAKIEEGR